MPFLPLLFACTVSIELPRRYAIVYGVSQYVDNSDTYPNLLYTDDDAQAIATLLENQKYDVVTLRLDEHATKAQLLSDITDLATYVEPDDLFLFYFSGHGAQADDIEFQKNIELPGTDEKDEWIFLHGSVGVEEQTGAMLIDYSKALNDDQLGQLMDQLSCEKKVAIIDACNSGGFIGNILEVDLIPQQYDGNLTVVDVDIIYQGAQRYFNYTDNREKNSDISPYNAIVISAAGEQELAFEDGGIAHGVFTYFVIESQEHGDFNGDGYVTVLEAYFHSKNRIEQEWNSIHLDSIYGSYYAFSPHISGGSVDFVLFQAR